MINNIVDLFSLVIQGVKTTGYSFTDSLQNISVFISQNLINLGHSNSSALATVGPHELYTVLALVTCISVGFILIRAFFGVFGLIKLR